MGLAPRALGLGGQGAPGALPRALGPGRLLQKPLARGVPGRPFLGGGGEDLVEGLGPLAWGPVGALGRGALGAGALPRGALGPGGPWPGGRLAPGGPGGGPKLSSLPGPLASLLVQESSYQGPGGPRGGGPANPEPKTLNRPPEAKGYALGLYFSYAKGGLGAGHPLAEY